MKIGVFDSGIGGEKIANRIKATYPKAEVVTVSDVKNLPYGTKSKQHLRRLVIPQLLTLQKEGCEVIIVACNTVTTLLISEIREVLKVPVIGFVPMVKPAAKLTKNGVIAVCATPATLASSRYRELKKLYASQLDVIEPDCSDWAALIEQNALSRQKIAQIVNEAVIKRADVIVLGCTHYHWIEDEINLLAKGRALVIQPEDAVMRQLANVLQSSGQSSNNEKVDKEA